MGLRDLELQKLADETGLNITVGYLPPGAGKWNEIEHKLFSFISQNGRGKPLTSLAAIVSLIAATTTRIGLKVKCGIDQNQYGKGIKISEEEIKKVNMERAGFHGDWNYTIKTQSLWFFQYFILLQFPYTVFDDTASCPKLACQFLYIVDAEKGTF